MAYAHIFTNDTGFVGCPEPSGWSECPVCGEMSKLQMGYIGIRHMCCGVILDDEDWLGSICKKRRTMILKMNRRQLSDVLGYSIHTIRRYEYVWCSRVYADKLMKFVKKHVASQKKENEGNSCTGEEKKSLS